MRVLQINSVCGVGSTGRMATSIHALLEGEGHESHIAYGRGTARNCSTAIRIGSAIDTYMHIAMTRLLDRHCFGSHRPTTALVRKIDDLAPDVIHLHNVHGYYINIEVLFNYLATLQTPVIWTLHDCWSFTGHCCYFDYIGCKKWRDMCHSCPQKREYPSSLFVDDSRRNFHTKQRLFTQLRNLVIVTPSAWLAGLVGQSFLRRYPVQVIRNGVDLQTFRPKLTTFRNRHGLAQKFVILGVANVWDRRKGLEYFLSLSERISNTDIVVVVGVTKSQKRILPRNVIGVEKTESVDELVDMYCAADVFVNPTLEDNFPTTNLESLACGTPVITFDSGGSSESIDASCGYEVPTGDVDALLQCISLIKNRGRDAFSRAARQRVLSFYDNQQQLQEYVSLYQRVAKLGLRGRDWQFIAKTC